VEAETVVTASSYDNRPH